jgi:ribonucleoside-diphosphate reductase alpha chain
MRLVNQGVSEALKNLEYAESDIKNIVAFASLKGTVVGAPKLKPEHEAVFDCALAPPGFPERRVTPEGHLRIMAAAQPFLSGAISKTVNLPVTFAPEDVEKLFLSAWKLGLKALAIYRDGSKALQPLCAEC